MQLDVAAYRRVAEKWALKDENINPSAAAVLMLQMCSELERLQKADYEFQAKLADGITDAFLDRRWIPVGERLPEMDERVMVANAADDWVTVGSRQLTGEYHHWDGDDSEELHKPTHWMPLPGPPLA
jgi:hypothetical protein